MTSFPPRLLISSGGMWENLSLVSKRALEKLVQEAACREVSVSVCHKERKQGNEDSEVVHAPQL